MYKVTAVTKVQGWSPHCRLTTEHRTKLWKSQRNWTTASLIFLSALLPVCDHSMFLHWAGISCHVGLPSVFEQAVNLRVSMFLWLMWKELRTIRVSVVANRSQKCHGSSYQLHSKRSKATGLHLGDGSHAEIQVTRSTRWIKHNQALAGLSIDARCTEHRQQKRELSPESDYGTRIADLKCRNL